MDVLLPKNSMSFLEQNLEGYFHSLGHKLEAFARAQRAHLVSQGKAPNPADYEVSFRDAQQVILHLSQTATLR